MIRCKWWVGVELIKWGWGEWVGVGVRGKVAKWGVMVKPGVCECGQTPFHPTCICNGSFTFWIMSCYIFCHSYCMLLSYWYNEHIKYVYVKSNYCDMLYDSCYCANNYVHQIQYKDRFMLFNNSKRKLISSIHLSFFNVHWVCIWYLF